MVIDNCSKDGTTDFIKKKFPHVKLKILSENLGFGGANNIGFAEAKQDKADYIYLLNQDTISYTNNIHRLIEATNKVKNLGVVSPLHLSETGDLLDSSFEEYITAKTCKDYISDTTLGNVKTYYELGFINAASWLIKVETVEFLGGLFSKAFYHYGEDVNFIGRLRKFGFKNLIVPGIYIHHCRKERVGGISKEFQDKIININKVNIMHDIKNPYSSCFMNILKYAFQQLSQGNFINAWKLISYPIFKYFSIKKYRRSYINRNLF